MIHRIMFWKFGFKKHFFLGCPSNTLGHLSMKKRIPISKVKDIAKLKVFYLAIIPFCLNLQNSNFPEASI